MEVLSLFMIKLKTGEMYKLNADSEVRVAVNQFRQQGIRGNVYQVWGHSRYQLQSF